MFGLLVNKKKKKYIVINDLQVEFSKICELEIIPQYEEKIYRNDTVSDIFSTIDKNFSPVWLTVTTKKILEQR